MGVEGFEHDNVTQPARLELIGCSVEDAAIFELVPAVLPAHARVEQAQSSESSRPAELRLKHRRRLGAASVVGATVLEANLPSQRQDGLSIDDCAGLSHGWQPPFSERCPDARRGLSSLELLIRALSAQPKYTKNG